MSGEIRTAAVTPARSIVPATSPPIGPVHTPTTMNAPIIAEVTAATGEPIPMATRR